MGGGSKRPRLMGTGKTKWGRFSRRKKLKEREDKKTEAEVRLFSMFQSIELASARQKF